MEIKLEVLCILMIVLKEQWKFLIVTKNLNVGSEEQVSINQLIQYIEEIAEFKISKKYLLDKPKGVRGRASDNTLIKDKIGWVQK